MLRWLTEAHAYGSLPVYVESLIDQPETVQPFVALPAQVEKAVYGSMRGKRPGFIKEVMRESVGDTVFLLRLVIGLNVELDELARTQQLGHADLVGWARSIEAAAPGKKTARSNDRWQGWEARASTLRSVLLGTERARAQAEVRYLDGHDCLFPELMDRWRALCAAVEGLGEFAIDDETQRAAAERIERVVRMARADGLDAAGGSREADAMAREIVRALV